MTSRRVIFNIKKQKLSAESKNTFEVSYLGNSDFFCIETGGLSCHFKY